MVVSLLHPNFSSFAIILSLSDINISSSCYRAVAVSPKNLVIASLSSPLLLSPLSAHSISFKAIAKRSIWEHPTFAVSKNA